MKKILEYSLSLGLLLILLTSPSSAQEDSTRVRGPRMGIDLASLSLLYLDPDRKIITLSVDYEAWQDIYPVIELGYQNVRISNKMYNYKSDGIFARIGADVNFLKYKQTDVYEMFYTGLRYGISYFGHETNSINIQDGYFSGISGGSLPSNPLFAHWISLVGGVRVQLGSNFFMGWKVLMNIKIAQTKDSSMEPYNIPGFGKGGQRVATVLNYTVSYRIPLQTYKPRKIIKKKEAPPQESIPLE